MFDEKKWRKEPYLCREFFNSAKRNEFTTPLFERWVAELPYFRVFVEKDDPDSTRVSRLIPQNAATDIFKRLQSSDQGFTVLINNVETICSKLADYRAELGVPFHWRLDDIIATFSSKGSGIGYHAGHEDAFIFQAKGQRHWKVWAANELSTDLKKSILLCNTGDDYKFESPQKDPIFECILNEGDVMYIPPFFPHEGVTLDESISIGFGWKGVSYYHFAQAFDQPASERFRDTETLPPELFEIINDCDLTNFDNSVNEISSEVVKRIFNGQGKSPAVESIHTKIKKLLSSGVSGGVS